VDPQNPQMIADLKALNEHWWVFALLALGFAIVALLIHRCLVKREGIKADFGASNPNPALDDNESPNKKKYSLESENKSVAAKATEKLGKLFGRNKSKQKEEEEEKQEDSVYHSMPGERQSKPNNNHFPAH